MAIIAAAFVFFIWMVVYGLLERFSKLTPDESFYLSLAVLVVFVVLGASFQKTPREPIKRKLERRLK